MKRIQFLLTTTILSLTLILGCTSSPKAPEASDEIASELNLLLKSPTLLGQIAMDDQGIRLYASPEDKKNGKAEIAIFPQEYATFRRLAAALPPDSLLAIYLAKGTDKWPEAFLLEQTTTPSTSPNLPDNSLPLSGMRIALDPGHTAGDMTTALIEGKYVRIRPSAETGREEIAFFEPNLTLATAHLIQKQLLALGAEVLMTRQTPGVNTRGISFETWKQNYIEADLQRAHSLGLMDSSQVAYLQKEPTEKELFANLYNRLDLWDRAEKINAFSPDLTLIIHYNVGFDNWRQRDAEGYYPAGDENYNMAFVPGSFMAGELAKPADRMAFLRQLLTDDIAQSIALSKAVVSHMTQKLGVPPVPQDAPLRYLTIASLPTEAQGVFARNLTLTRLIKGTMCYGESLCQDEKNEALRLNQKDTIVAGVRVSSRVREVADAYVVGVVEYVEKMRR